VTRLAVRGVRVRFGGNAVLDNVDLDAEAGEVTGLIGPNGAGKTTLFNVIVGLQPANGVVSLDGTDLSHLAPHRRARAGLARTFQRLELFSLLSVRRNIRVAADIHARTRRDRSIDPDQSADAIIERLGLAEVADTRVDQLPTGQARLVEVGRALATHPKVLLLDEPASGQTDDETDRFADLLRELAAEGMAVVLVEHDVQLVMRVCRQVCVLDLGRVICTGPPAVVQADEQVLIAYLGPARAAS
jgi:branched-chain amino acid transport system ATP-binding protein